MKKIVLLIFILHEFIYSSLAQSKVHEYINSKGHFFKIVELGPHINDGKYEKAINTQLGIIGSDYYKNDTIGTAPAEEKKVSDTWYPIALDKRNKLSYKTTSVGILKENERRMPSATADFFSSNFAGQEADDDWNFNVIQQGTIVSKIDIYGKPADIRHDIVRYEIDVPDYFKDFFSETKEYTPKLFTPLAAYGPLVTDQGHGPRYVVEIHPAEQLWWTKQTEEKITKYLISISDASTRFSDPDSYDANNVSGEDPTWRGMWQKVPQENIFAIPVLINKKQKKEEITIKDITSFEVINPYFLKPMQQYVSDYAKIKQQNYKSANYYLTYQNDTILHINYIGSLGITISIDNFGFDPYSYLKNNDTIYKGFIVIKSVIKSLTGHQVLKVEQKNKNQHLEKPCEYTFDVTLELKSITCEDLGTGLSVNQYSPEKCIALKGDIGLIGQGINQNIGAIAPLIGNNLLAHYSNYMTLRKGETKRLDIRKKFKIHESEEFSILGFLRERSDWSMVNNQNPNASIPFFDERYESFDVTGPTMRGAELFFNTLNVSKEFIIEAESNHKTKIKIRGSVTVTNKIKIIPTVLLNTIGQ